MMFLDEHTDSTDSKLYWIGVAVYLLFLILVTFAVWKGDGYAQSNKEVWWVWGLWFVYITLYTISVGIIFGEVAHKLDTSDTYGPNCLKFVLCIAPALLVLVLQLVISPSYRKGVLVLSVFAALDLFDGIEMLEIVLMQNEKEGFKLNDAVEKCIVAFACLSFVATSLGLTRNKVDGNETVEERGNPKAMCLGLLLIMFTNVPFLGLRVYVWVDCGYDASIFIAKNVVSLVVGLVEFCIACKCCTCE